MSKDEESTTDEEKPLPVSLEQTPTEYGLVFRTPNGVLDMNQYFAWLGNQMVDIKEALVGK